MLFNGIQSAKQKTTLGLDKCEGLGQYSLYYVSLCILNRAIYHGI